MNATKEISKYFFLAVLIFSQIACNDELVDFEPSAERTFGIRHDKSLSQYEGVALNQGAEYPHFGAVVCFLYSLDGTPSQEFVASGTLIDKNWILTAGHNFYVAEEQDSPALPGGITVVSGHDPNNPDQTYQVSEVVYHPTWLQNNRDFVYGNDLALVKLATPIEDILPVEMYTDSDETIGSKVWFSGYGDFSGLAGQEQNVLTNKHAIENILDRKASDIITEINGTGYNGGLLAFDFDSPNGSGNTLGDETINEDEELLGDGSSDNTPLEFEGATVTGDSGGPLFVKDGNTWKVAGVLSGGANNVKANHEDGDYGDISVFIRVSQHDEWIRSIIQ